MNFIFRVIYSLLFAVISVSANADFVVGVSGETSSTKACCFGSLNSNPGLDKHDSGSASHAGQSFGVFGRYMRSINDHVSVGVHAGWVRDDIEWSLGPFQSFDNALDTSRLFHTRNYKVRVTDFYDLLGVVQIRGKRGVSPFLMYGLTEMHAEMMSEFSTPYRVAGYRRIGNAYVANFAGSRRQKGRKVAYGADWNFAADKVLSAMVYVVSYDDLIVPPDVAWHDAVDVRQSGVRITYGWRF